MISDDNSDNPMDWSDAKWTLHRARRRAAGYERNQGRETSAGYIERGEADDSAIVRMMIFLADAIILLSPIRLT